MMDFINNPSTWILFSFIVLVSLLAQPLYRLVTSALDDRARNIKEQLQKADELVEQAEALLASTQIRSHNVEAEVEAILEHARLEADRMSSEAKSKVEAIILNQEKMADDLIYLLEDEAENKIRQSIVDVSMKIVRQYMNDNLSIDEKQKITEKMIKDIEIPDVQLYKPAKKARKIKSSQTINS